MYFLRRHYEHYAFYGTDHEPEWGGGAEFAGPENYGPKMIKDWKMQDLSYNNYTVK